MADTHSSRRRFLKAVPAAVAGAVATNAWAQGQGPAGPISADMVDCAEKIAGLEFHASEEAAIAGSLNQNLSSYQQLRDVGDPPRHAASAHLPSIPAR